MKPNERMFLRRAVAASEVTRLSSVAQERIKKMLQCPELFDPTQVEETVRRCLRYTNALQRALQLEES